MPATLADMELEAATPVHVLETVLRADTRLFTASLVLVHRTVRPVKWASM